jgi:diguanylate cyclase (GGDEF)-like protein
VSIQPAASRIGLDRGGLEVRVPDADKSISRSRQLVKTSVVLTAALILAALFAIWQLRLGAIKDTEDDNHRLGVVIAEQTARTFQAVDLVLQEMSETIVSTGLHDGVALRAAFDAHDVHEALMKRLADLPQAEAFAILDAEGRYVNQSRQWPTPDLSFADRSFFRHFAAVADPSPYISEPIASRANAGMVTVYLARRITARDGIFLGVVTGAIRLSYFDTFFHKIGLLDGTGITILRDNGLVLAHYPSSSVFIGTKMPERSPWYKVVPVGGGHYLSPGVAGDNQGSRLVSVHPLGTYPIVVDITRQESAALARWRRQTLVICAGVSVVTLCFALLLMALRRQITIIEKSVDTVRSSEARVAAQSAVLETTLEHMNHGLMMVDAAGNVAVCNRRAIDILELPPTMMAEHPPIAGVIEFQRRQGEFADWTDNRVDPTAQFTDHSIYERRRPNGTVIEVRSTAMPGGGMVRTYADVTARTVAEEMLGRAASHDQLTGLINRNGFTTRREAALATARRNNSELAVLCLDLDRFKAVNDTLGHDAGDQLLIMVAQRMRETARATDVVARVGGDEFAIVLPDAGLATAEQISQRLLDTIRSPYLIGEETVRIGVSIGLAIYPSDGGTSEELLRNADSALYKAKATGRDTWLAYASQDGQRQHERLALELDLRTAVATGQFELAYQPIWDLTTNLPVAFEALVRWNHPTRGVIPPDGFIPIAEQIGLMIPLGHWIIETACAEAATWPVPMRIAVNLSPAQFRERELVSFIRGVLAATGVAPSRLDLEVTEGLLLRNATDVVNTMTALRAMGIRMVLDDFGTAHSSLSYLRGFPFEVVKIDRSFMRALNTDRQARALMEAILAMARALGLEVVGEGVETQEQVELLRHLRCGLVQGYLLGRPASARETHELIWRLAGSPGETLPRATSAFVLAG